MTQMETQEISGINLGNTNPDLSTEVKRPSQSQYWCFTYNNYKIEHMELLEMTFKKMDCAYIFQEEVGGDDEENPGTPHLQGYMEFRGRRGRWSELKLPKQIHWEKRKGSRAQNVQYCSKEYTWIGTPKRFSHDLKPPKKMKLLEESQLRDWQKGVLTVIGVDPDDRTLHWIWSSKGNLGKTTFCKYLAMRHGAIPLAGKGNDVRNGVVTYLNDKGHTPELIVVPIPRSYDSSYLSYEALENCKDMFFYSGKYEGGAVCGNCPHVFVFANFPPDESKMSEDRWKVWQIDGDDPDGFPGGYDRTPMKTDVKEAIARGCANARKAKEEKIAMEAGAGRPM